MEKPVTNAEDLFARALDLPPGEARDALIATQCAGDSPLRQEVESLLPASVKHPEANRFTPLGSDFAGEDEESDQDIEFFESIVRAVEGDEPVGGAEPEIEIGYLAPAPEPQCSPATALIPALQLSP